MLDFQAIVTLLFFTPDNRLVFGMSIEYEEDNEEAERVLLILKEEFGTTIGGISCETPPGEAYEWLTKNES